MKQTQGKRPQKRSGAASPATIARAEREREAIVLRRGGASYDDIATRLGFADRSGAKKAVERGLSRWMRDSDEELRAMELERSEVIIARLWPLIDSDPPDLKAIDTLMKVVDYRAKIAGLYAPRRDRIDIAVHARVEYRKLDALRVLQADPQILAAIDAHIAPTIDATEASHGD